MAGRDRIADAAYALALLVVAGIVLREAGQLAPAPFDPLGPKTFPIWISYGLIGLSLAMIAQLVAGRDLGKAQQSMVLGVGDDADHAQRPWAALALLGLTALYAAALSIRGVGFALATGGFLFLAGLALTGFARRQAPKLAATAIIFALALDAVFRRIFALDLP
jgi:hypothetical protein